MIIQGNLLEDPLWGLFIALFLFSAVVVGLYSWIRRIRERQIDMLNSILSTSFSISTAELSEILDKRQLDRSTVVSIVKGAENAVLSFGGTRVLSRPMMYDRIKDMLTENAIVHVQRLAIQWDISEVIIGEVIQEITSREGLDVVLTTEGDYILVPDFKARMRDLLELHGRLDLANEAQKMRVSKNDLVRLVEAWKWNLVESSEGLLLSMDWLRGVLERSVEREGFLDPPVLAERFDISQRDILDGIKAFRWNMVSTTDGRMLPYHILSEQLKQKLESEGFLELPSEADRIKIKSDNLEKIIKGFGASYVFTSDDSVLALTHLRERLLEDLALLGVITPEETAKGFGVTVQTIQALLEREPNVRKSKGGRFISLVKFREWIFDIIKTEGIISAKQTEHDWGLRSFELAAFLKRFGIRTITNRDDDHLSLSWTRRWMLSDLSKGLEVTPQKLVDLVNIAEGEAEALIYQLEADALLTREGGLVPTTKIKEDAARIFSEEGVIDIQKISMERGLDVADIEDIVDSLELESIKSSDGRYLSKESILKPLRWRLSNDGIYDLHSSARNLKLEYTTLADLIDDALSSDEFIVDEVGVIVTDKWIKDIQEFAASRGYIQVTSEAKQRGLRRSAFISLLRRYLKGAYVPRSDSYIVSNAK